MTRTPFAPTVAFWLPGDDLRSAIAVGSQVRLLLWSVDEDGPGRLVAQCERMWALVEAVEGDVVRGRLTSAPLEHDWQEHRGFLQAIFDGDDAFEEWKRAHAPEL